MLCNPVHKVFPVKVTELDICYVFSLNLSDTEGALEIRYNVCLVLGVSYNPYCLINIYGNCRKTEKQVKLVLLLAEVKGQLARNAA